MRFINKLLLAMLLMATSGTAVGLDSIRTTKGTTINGTLQEMNPQEIVLKLANGSAQHIAIGDIESVKFGGEPPQLNVARTAALAGKLEEALRSLDKLAQEGKGLDRPEVLQDLHYWQAYCAAKLALAGSGDILAAGKQMREFVQKNANSYHYLNANELLGDLLTAIDKPDLAQQNYAVVERLAPSNDIKMRARIAQGNADAAQGKWPQALAAFDGALTLAGNEQSALIDHQRHLANLGKATCLAAMDKSEESIKLAEAVIAAADPEDAELCAKAYNALGSCLRKAGRSKDALLAFLHVDILYASQPAAHAEALKNLTELWSEVGNPARAAEAQDILKSRYANSRWAKR
jgi:tetratricopeptide (TPR) repeat protein